MNFGVGGCGGVLGLGLKRRGVASPAFHFHLPCAALLLQRMPPRWRYYDSLWSASSVSKQAQSHAGVHLHAYLARHAVATTPAAMDAVVRACVSSRAPTNCAPCITITCCPTMRQVCIL
jgi:hypothetical protein